jgi:TDG/mug DNA glycosylase family protein
MTDSILPDVLEPGLRVVFCGTAAGHASAQTGAYYAGPGNRFWPTLYRIGLTPRLLQPHEYREALGYGIGLTNMVPNAVGLDKDLKAIDFAPEVFREKMLKYGPRCIAFNGKKAAAAFYGSSTAALRYGLQVGEFGGAAVFVLPSTSGAAQGFWDEGQWRALGEWTRKSA